MASSKSQVPRARKIQAYALCPADWGRPWQAAVGVWAQAKGFLLPGRGHSQRGPAALWAAWGRTHQRDVVRAPAARGHLRSPGQWLAQEAFGCPCQQLGLVEIQPVGGGEGQVSPISPPLRACPAASERQGQEGVQAVASSTLLFLGGWAGWDGGASAAGGSVRVGLPATTLDTMSCSAQWSCLCMTLPGAHVVRRL